MTYLCASLSCFAQAGPSLYPADVKKHASFAPCMHGPEYAPKMLSGTSWLSSSTLCSKLKLTPADAFLQKAPISFDASVQV